MTALKTLLFYCIWICLLATSTLILAEAGAYLYLRFMDQQRVGRSEIQQSLESSHDQEPDQPIPTTVDSDPEWVREYVIHPYLGFTRNADLGQHTFLFRPAPVPVNEFGFFGDSPLKMQDPDRIHIALMGGSVATDAFLEARDRLKAELSSLPEWQGKEICISSIALGGYKQPQQLMALNYFLSIGTHFDVIVNLDGFNEVVLPFVENRPAGVNPWFPRSWHLYANKAMNPDDLSLVGQIVFHKQRHQQLKQRFSQPLLRQSNIALIVWHLLQQHHRANLVALESCLRSSVSQQTLSRQESGPDYTYTSEQALFDEAIHVWLRSSIQMARICEGLGIRYLHFLQPNQYVSGSKTFTENERKYAIGESDCVYRQDVEKGYPGLIAAGDKLRMANVAFFDLTGLFKHVQEDVYQDMCCHLNVYGNQLMVTEIAQTIGRQIAISQ